MLRHRLSNAAHWWCIDSCHCCYIAHKTYVKVRCEGDRTRPIYAKRREDDADTASFEDAKFGFIIVHSNAVVLIKARDQSRGNFYGQV